MNTTALINNIKNGPHWRISFQPNEYEEKAINSLSKCMEIIEKNQIRLRGWPYPYISPSDKGRENGTNWVSSWADRVQLEYWRFYQSTQFIHLFSLSEENHEFKEKLESNLKFHTEHDLSKVEGYLSFLNTIYTITEIFEFLIRLILSDVYKEVIFITIELFHINNFVISDTEGRIIDIHKYSQDKPIKVEYQNEVKVILAKGSEISLNLILELFDQFSYTPPKEIVKEDQRILLSGKFINK